MYQLSNVRVYTYREWLGYVISVPLVHKRTFTMLRMIPIPVPVDQEHFLYIDMRESLLCLDQTKQYYFTMTDDELSRCKWAEPGRYVRTPAHAAVYCCHGVVRSDTAPQKGQHFFNV